MHIHSATHHASSARSQGASDAKLAQPATNAPPLPATADVGSPNASGAATGGTAASNPFSSLSSGLQALLLGVGQNGQSAQGGVASGGATGALQAYAQSNLLG